MKKHTLLFIITLTLYSCRDTPRPISQLEVTEQSNVKELEAEVIERDKEEEFNDKLSETVYLKYLLGMTKKEVNKHTNKLIKKRILKEGEYFLDSTATEYYSEMNVVPDKKASRVFIQENYTNNYLVNLDIAIIAENDVDINTLLFYTEQMYIKKYGKPQQKKNGTTTWSNDKYSIELSIFLKGEVIIHYNDNKPDYSKNIEKDDRIEASLDDI